MPLLPALGGIILREALRVCQVISLQDFPHFFYASQPSAGSNWSSGGDSAVESGLHRMSARLVTAQLRQTSFPLGPQFFACLFAFCSPNVPLGLTPGSSGDCWGIHNRFGPVAKFLDLLFALLDFHHSRLIAKSPAGRPMVNRHFLALPVHHRTLEVFRRVS